jgi:hypothetical protein
MFTSKHTENVGGTGVENLLAGIKPEPGWDELIDEVSKEYMPVTQFLLDQGLRYELTNKIPSTVLHMEQVSPQGWGENSESKDRPITEIVQLPLPFTHTDFREDPERPRNGREAIARVCQGVECMTLGRTKYHGVRGLLQSQNPSLVLSRGLYLPHIWMGQAVERLQELYYYGPYCLVYRDCDLGMTCRAKFKNNAEKLGVRLVESNELLADQMILFNAQPETIRMVVGLKLCVTRWEDHLKAVCMMVPQIRTDVSGIFGIIPIIQ